MIALPDIRPAAVEHLLVIPREHVPNVSSLTAADVHLGEGDSGQGCAKQLVLRKNICFCQIVMGVKCISPGTRLREKALSYCCSTSATVG